jgi:hypothetical protein
MKIIVHKKTLTDGSAVYNVELLQGRNQIILHAPDEMKAREVAAQIRDAVNECLNDAVETIYDYPR